MKLWNIGILTALIVGCSDDDRDAAWWRNEKEIINLKSEIELAQFKLDRTKTHDRGQIPGNMDASELRKEIEELASVKADLVLDIARLETGWEDFQAALLQERRTEAMGQTFETFETSKGRIYRNATVTRIDDGGVSLRHSAGTARLRYSDLSQEEHSYFGLDADLAQATHEQERMQRAEYERWVAQGLAAAEKKEEKRANLRRLEDQKRASLRALASNTRSASAGSTSALTSSFGKLGDTTPRYSSYRYGRYSSYGSYYSRPRTRYVYYYNVPSNRTTWNNVVRTPTYRSIAAPSVPYSPVCPTNPFNP